MGKEKPYIDPAPHNKPFWATDVTTGETLVYPERHSKAGQPLFRRRFIPAKLLDNPYLYEQGDYEAMLLSLPEVQRKQLLEGSWDIAEGAAFSENYTPGTDINKNYKTTRVYGTMAGFDEPQRLLQGCNYFKQVLSIDKLCRKKWTVYKT